MPDLHRSLEEWLAYISKTHPSEIEMGLDRIRSVFSKFELANTQLIKVLFAGTNGKGSTLALAEQGLRSQGLRVGSYISPHILKYNERVRIDGEDIDDQSLIEAFEVVDSLRGDVALTYFEFGTLAALYVLFNADLDVVLLEVGLGGRLDAVNIVDADYAVITSVDLDHVEWLGTDIEKIGVEKAGILRSDCTFLAGRDLPDSVFDVAQRIGCEVLSYGTEFSIGKDKLNLTAKSGVRATYSRQINQLLPDNNVALALQLVVCIVDQVNELSLFEALSSLKVPGRLEKCSGYSNLFLDVGHNPHAARFLATFLQEKREEGMSVRVVYSALNDKDIGGVIDVMSPFVDEWYIASLDVDRAIPLENLKSVVGAKAENVLSFDSIDQALKQALDQAKALSEPVARESVSNEPQQTINSRNLTLVFGSFYVVEAAKKYLSNHE